jgi:hypothetical protein
LALGHSRFLMSLLPVVVAVQGVVPLVLEVI